MAMGNMALDPLEEMLQQPGCPNLFWALTDLPQPFIDLRKAIQGDRITAEAIFSLIEGKEIMSETKLQEAIKRFCPEGEPSGQNYDGELLKARAANQEIVEAARGRLIENGLSGRMFKQFHPLQVILLDEKYLFEKEFDEATKALNLPFWQYEVVQVGRHLPPRPEERKPSWRGWTYFHKVKMAQVRLEQRLALLRCIEALRLYAAEHGGQLPAQLADIKLPLPVDPVTGQPFAYKLEGGVVKLRGTPPRGMEKNAAFNRRYEITIKK
jgi:hypothetical protein